MFHIHLVNSPSVLKSIKQFFSSSSVPKRLQRFQLSVTRSKQQNRISFSIYSLPSGCLNKGVTPEIFFFVSTYLRRRKLQTTRKNWVQLSEGSVQSSCIWRSVLQICKIWRFCFSLFHNTTETTSCKDYIAITKSGGEKKSVSAQLSWNTAQLVYNWGFMKTERNQSITRQSC